MQLTRYTDFALRTVIYLGAVRRSATITEISERYGISRNHLVKVVHHMGKLGFLRTTRGKSGGLALGRKPSDINIGEIVRAMEPNFNVVECLDTGIDNCPIAPTCRMIEILDKAKDAFLSVLDGYTLADLIEEEDRRDILSLLGISEKNGPLAKTV